MRLPPLTSPGVRSAPQEPPGRAAAPPAPPAPGLPHPRPASRPRAAPAPRGPSLRRDGSTGAGRPGRERSRADSGQPGRGRASGEPSAQHSRSGSRSAPHSGRLPSCRPAGRPQRDGDAAPPPGADAGEGPGAAGRGSPLRALASLEPSLDLLLGARRLSSGLGWGPALLLRPPASSLPGGEPHLVFYLEFEGEGRGGRGRCGVRVVPVYCSLPLSFLGGPCFSFVSRDEVTRPGKLAERGCVALLAFGGCVSRFWCFEGSEGLCGAVLECQA